MHLMQVASIDHHHLPQCVSNMTMWARVLITIYVGKKLILVRTWVHPMYDAT